MAAPVYPSLPITQIVYEYQSGDSLRTIAKRHCIGYGTARRVVAAAGVRFRSANTVETHTVKNPYVSSKSQKFWDELTVTPDVGLHPAEIARLRKAVGWEPDWTQPYDAINGD